MLDFSIVIPARNAEKTIGRCLDSLLDQDYPKEKYEIIAVDNDSTDNTAEIIKKYPVKCLFNKKQGCGPTRNAAIKNARGRIIASIDSKEFADRSWLKEAKKEFSKGRVDLLAGAILPAEDFSTIKKIILEMSIDQEFSVKKGHPCPGNLFIKRAVFSKIGYFNERLWLYCEDVEWGLRATNMGFKLGFSPNIVVYHSSPRSFGGMIKREFIRGKAMAHLKEIGKSERYLKKGLGLKNSLVMLQRVLKKNKQPFNILLAIFMGGVFKLSYLGGQFFEKIRLFIDKQGKARILGLSD